MNLPRFSKHKFPTLFFSLLTISVFFTLSCNPNKDDGEQTIKEGRTLGAILPQAKLLEGQSLSMAENICTVLREKSIYLDQRGNEIFDFQLTDINSQGQRSKEAVSMRINRDNFVLASTYLGPYFSLVETHQNGIMQALCQKVLGQIATSNTFSAGARRYLYEFFPAGGSKLGLMFYNARNSYNGDPNYVIEEIQEWRVEGDYYNGKTGLLLYRSKKVLNREDQSKTSLTSELVDIR